MKMFRSFVVVVMFLSSITFSQLKGKVLDATNSKPVPFANLLLVDLATGTSADEEGNYFFDIEIPNHNKLKVTALGFSDLIIEINESSNRGDLILKLTPKHYHLHEAVISTGTGILQDYSITPVASKPLDELNIIGNTNLGESISNLAGVYNASTGQGIYKPVIRGLSAIRVTSFLNGVRIENQQWGGDHGLGVSSIGIGHVEVIKGPSSLLYGADALGGVLYLKDESYAQNNTIELSAASQVESNAMGIQNSLSFKMSKNNLRFNIYANQQSFADYEIPDGRFVKTSRFNGKGAKVLVGYNKNKWVTNFSYNISNNTVGIPGHTHDSAATTATFLRSERVREEGRPSQKINNHFFSWDNQFFFHKSELKITLGQMMNRLAEYEKFTIPELGMDLNTSTYYLRYKYRISKELSIISGLQGMYQTNLNLTNAEQQLIPNLSSFDNGAFLMLAGKKDKLNYQLGLRYDQRQINVSDALNENFNYSGLNYSAGMSYKLSDVLFRLNISSGFRTPHVSELLSDGGHSAVQRYEIGNIDLIPEIGNQLDLAVDYGNEHLNLILNPFANVIQNFVYLQPDDSIINGYQVHYYQQVEQARLLGGEFIFHFHPHFLHDFHLESNYSFVYAEDNQGNALSFIPQSRLSTQITYSFDYEKAKIFEIENLSVQHQFFADQNRVVLGEVPSSSYNLLHLAINTKLTLKSMEFNIAAGVKNLLNESYIDHLSALKQYGIQNSGRNIYVSLKYNLTRKLK